MTHNLSKFSKANAFRFFITFTLFILPNTAAAQDYDFTETKAILDSYVSQDKLAGGVVMVMKDGKAILHYASGMQDKEADVKMEKDSLFRLASQSKALTNVAIMMLKERGLLKVTDPVSKYIPPFAKTTVLVVKEDKTQEVVPAKREITIHDLLTHSSGISYGWGPVQDQWEKAGLLGWYYADKDQTIQEALATITTIPHEAQPGEKFVYGHSSDILGAIIEIASGKSFRDFLLSEITLPLGMIDTDFYVPEEKINRLATLYSSTETTIIRTPDAENSKDFSKGQGHYASGPRKAYSGGSGLISTARDYSIFLNMLLNNGTLDGVTILSPETVALMTIDQIPYIDMTWNDGLGYAFQLTKGKSDTTKGKVIQYEWNGAYHTAYYVRPLDGVTVVYLAQLMPAKKMRDWVEINAAIRRELNLE